MRYNMCQVHLQLSMFVVLDGCETQSEGEGERERQREGDSQVGYERFDGHQIWNISFSGT